MSTKLFYLILEVDRSVIPRQGLATMVADLFERLLPIYEPRRVTGRGGAASRFELKAESHETWGDQPLWLGEEVSADSPITRCLPGNGGELISGVRQTLGSENLSSVVIRSEGALRHRIDESPAAWFGRWCITTPPALIDFANVRMDWRSDSRTVEFFLSMSGYPLTACRLGSEGHLDDGDPQLAAANRREICTVLKGLPDAMQLKRGEFRWCRDGDFAPLFPRDAADIDDVWIPFLNG